MGSIVPAKCRQDRLPFQQWLAEQDEANLVPLVAYKRPKADITCTLPGGALSISDYAKTCRTVSRMRLRSRSSRTSLINMVIHRGRVWGAQLGHKFC
jgi:hypothetical protein